jgi:hypothetical protein
MLAESSAFPSDIQKRKGQDIQNRNFACCFVRMLTFQSLRVTLHTTRFNIKTFYMVPTLRLCVLYGSQNKQQLLPYKTLRDWFL